MDRVSKLCVTACRHPAFPSTWETKAELAFWCSSRTAGDVPNWLRWSIQGTVDALAFSLQAFLSCYTWQGFSKHNHINPAPCQCFRKWQCHSSAKISRGAAYGLLAGHVFPTVSSAMVRCCGNTPLLFSFLLGSVSNSQVLASPHSSSMEN